MLMMSKCQLIKGAGPFYRRSIMQAHTRKHRTEYTVQISEYIPWPASEFEFVLCAESASQGSLG